LFSEPAGILGINAPISGVVDFDDQLGIRVLSIPDVQPSGPRVRLAPLEALLGDLMIVLEQTSVPSLRSIIGRKDLVPFELVVEGVASEAETRLRQGDVA
jgi:hypothetical protein